MSVDPPTAAGLSPNRRGRTFASSAEALLDVVAQKILHGWLQNSNQVLVPLTVNIHRLAPRQREAIAAALPSLLLIGRRREEAAERAKTLRDWLAIQGAPTEALEAFDRALDEPQALSTLIENGSALGIDIYLFICAMLAADTRHPASMLLCDLLEARLGLAPPVIRSAIRRFGPNRSSRFDQRA